jgi:hypothetical protein
LPGRIIDAPIIIFHNPGKASSLQKNKRHLLKKSTLYNPKRIAQELGRNGRSWKSDQSAQDAWMMPRMTSCEIKNAQIEKNRRSFPAQRASFVSARFALIA